MGKKDRRRKKVKAFVKSKQVNSDGNVVVASENSNSLSTTDRTGGPVIHNVQSDVSIPEDEVTESTALVGTPPSSALSTSSNNSTTMIEEGGDQTVETIVVNEEEEEEEEDDDDDNKSVEDTAIPVHNSANAVDEANNKGECDKKEDDTRGNDALAGHPTNSENGTTNSNHQNNNNSSGNDHECPVCDNNGASLGPGGFEIQQPLDQHDTTTTLYGSIESVDRIPHRGAELESNHSAIKISSMRKWSSIVLLYLMMITMGVDFVTMWSRHALISSSFRELKNTVQLPLSYLFGGLFIWHFPVMASVRGSIFLSSLIASSGLFISSKIDDYGILLVSRFIVGLGVCSLMTNSIKLFDILQRYQFKLRNLLIFHFIIGCLIGSYVSTGDWDDVLFILSVNMLMLSLLSMIVISNDIKVGDAVGERVDLKVSNIIIVSLFIIVNFVTAMKQGESIKYQFFIQYMVFAIVYYVNDVRSKTPFVPYLRKSCTGVFLRGFFVTLGIVWLYSTTLMENIVKYGNANSNLVLIIISILLGMYASRVKLVTLVSLPLFIFTLFGITVTIYKNHNVIVLDSMLFQVLLSMACILYTVHMVTLCRENCGCMLSHSTETTRVYVFECLCAMFGLFLCDLYFTDVTGDAIQVRLRGLVSREHSLKQINKIIRRSRGSVAWVHEDAPGFARSVILQCSSGSFANAYKAVFYVALAVYVACYPLLPASERSV